MRSMRLSRDSQPMMEMNTTPLIDVMLVLLVMFIITIPVATHITQWSAGPSEPIDRLPLDRTMNRVVVTTDNRILWDDRPVTERQLGALLQRSLQLPIEPELQFQPQGQASYDLSAKVMRIVVGSGVTKFGVVGNDQFAEFGKAARTR